MQRRLREESAEIEAQKLDKKHKLDYENPYLRAKIGELESQIEALKLDNAELTKSYYELLKRIDNA
jgi:hypothetical protein